jgi:hypothetical protein
MGISEPSEEPDKNREGIKPKEAALFIFMLINQLLIEN